MYEELHRLRKQMAQASAEMAYNKAMGGARGFLDRQASNKYLYFAKCGDAVKIGISSDPPSRIKDLQTGAPGRIEIVASVPYAGHLESKCHKKLSHLHITGEWYRHTNEVDALIKELTK